MRNTVASDLDPEILVIEDDLEIRRFLRTTLCAEHYRLREAATAADGLKQVSLREPNVIVLDLGLPDTDGLEVIRKIRQSKRMRGLSSIRSFKKSLRQNNHNSFPAGVLGSRTPPRLSFDVYHLPVK